MKEFEIMPNGNVKFLGIPLGSKIIDACKELSSLGLTLKTENGYTLKYGNDNRIRFSTSLSFAKSCQVEIWAENSGNRLNTIFIHGDINKSIIPSVALSEFQKFAKENNLDYKETQGEHGINVFIASTDKIKIDLNIPSNSVGIVAISIKFVDNLHYWSGGKYVYDERFVTSLYMDYLRNLAEEKSNGIKINAMPYAKQIWKVLLVISIIVIFYFIASCYRYNTFKDKNKFLRYDKWTERYEKYDIPTRQWEPI